MDHYSISICFLSIDRNRYINLSIGDETFILDEIIEILGNDIKINYESGKIYYTIDDSGEVMEILMKNDNPICKCELIELLKNIEYKVNLYVTNSGN